MTMIRDKLFVCFFLVFDNKLLYNKSCFVYVLSTIDVNNIMLLYNNNTSKHDNTVMTTQAKNNAETTNNTVIAQRAYRIVFAY